MQEILRLIAASPVGISAGELARRTQLSRATINRRIKEALGANLILAKGAGAARVYLDADPLRPIREYFVTPHTERPFARFREALLDYTPSLAATPIIATRDFSPLESAFYLLTRLPYLQAFVDGNKRTSRGPRTVEFGIFLRNSCYATRST